MLAYLSDSHDDDEDHCAEYRNCVEDEQLASCGTYLNIKVNY